MLIITANLTSALRMGKFAIASTLNIRTMRGLNSKAAAVNFLLRLELRPRKDDERMHTLRHPFKKTESRILHAMLAYTTVLHYLFRTNAKAKFILKSTEY